MVKKLAFNEEYSAWCRYCKNTVVEKGCYVNFIENSLFFLLTYNFYLDNVTVNSKR